MNSLCIFCLNRFHSGNFDLNIEPVANRSQKSSKIIRKALVEEGSSHTTSKLARLIHLRQIGKIKKLAFTSYFSLPYELIEQQHQNHVKACRSSIATQFTEF